MQLTPSVVPDAVVGELHGVRVLRLLKVLVGVAAHVAPAADVPADQTDPQVLQHKGQLWGAAAPSDSVSHPHCSHSLSKQQCLCSHSPSAFLLPFCFPTPPPQLEGQGEGGSLPIEGSNTPAGDG